MEETTRKHWNLYYLFLADMQEHPMPPKRKQQITDAFGAALEAPEGMDWRETWREKN